MPASPLRTVAIILTSCAAGAAALAQDDARAADPTLSERAREHIEAQWQRDYKAPEFGKDKAWLNVSRPLSLREDLAGRVVLVDFWTYCCINCIHVLPDLEYLEAKYAQAPFVVVGCHSAKFTNEAEAANIRQAVLRYDIAHPVVVDDEFAIWNSFGVRSWPTLALIGADGRLLGGVSGEGNREVLDVLIAEALAFYAARPDTPPAKPLPWRREANLELARELSFPGKLIADAEGKRLFISDSNHHRIVVTSLDGAFERTIGSGRRGLKDGPAADAELHKPQGMAFHRGALLIADTENHALRRFDPSTGAVTTIAGDGKQGHDREGSFEPLKVSLNSPWDLLALGDDVLIAMAGPHQIWKLDMERGRIGPFAGDGTERKADGPFDSAAFAQPSGLAEKDGIVFVADSESSSVRTLDLRSERVATLAGGDTNPRNLFHFGDEDGAGLGKRLQHALGVLVHDGVLYVADTYNHKIKTIDRATGEVRTFAGTGKAGAADGPAAQAEFHEPSGLAAVGRRLHVADTNNHRVRVIDLDSRTVTTLLLRGVPVPMAAAVASGKEAEAAGPLPDLAGTVRHALVAVKLAPGKAELRLKLELGAGEKLAAGAPSQYRILVKEGGVRPAAAGGKLESADTAVTLDVESAGKLEVQALYYHCRGNESCSVRSARWDLTLDVGEGGKSALELVDRTGG